MTTKRTRLVAGFLGALVLSSPLAAATGPKMIFTNLEGRLHIVQNVPCGATVDTTTSVSEGRLEMTPVSPGRGGPDSVRFDLTRLDLFLTPFSIDHECLGVKATAAFREIGVRLAKPITFTAEATGGVDDRQYRFSIPKEQVLIFESILNNLPVPQPETAYQRPSEDVTGEIDLRQGTVQLHVALASTLRFRAGCAREKCVIDEELKGTQTVDIIGTANVERAKATTRKR